MAGEPNGNGPKAWKRLRRGPASDYRIFRIHQDDVENPRNASGLTISLVECPDWINIIPVTRDGQVVFIRQFRFGVWANTLEIPGGMVEPDEDPLAGAARELEEETGYVAGRIVPLGFVHPNPAFQTNRCHAYLALDCDKAHDGRPDEGEDILVELRAQDEVAELIRSGQVTHSLVLTAFYLAQLHGQFPVR
jgi:8-oxo-dGTP pyrophosphatase MutT (NUDIX family)